MAFFHTDYFENEIVTQEELKESMIKLLGNNTTYTDETIRSLYYPEERVAIYDKNKQTYTYTSETAHGHTAAEILYYIDSYKFNGEILLVTTYRLYYLHGDIGPVTEIYKDYDLKTKIEVDNKYCMKEYGDDICAIDYETYIKEHKNNAERVTYTFNLSNNYPTFIEMK